MTNPDLSALTSAIAANPRDPVTIQALADWIEEQGASGTVVRALTIEGPTVLIFGHPDNATENYRHSLECVVWDIRDFVTSHVGHPVFFAVMPSSVTIRQIRARPPEQEIQTP